MSGTTFVRCACRDENGKQLGAKCSELGKRHHGTRMVQTYLHTSSGRVRYKRTVGPVSTTNQAQAKALLDQINDLVKLGTDAGTVARIGDLIVAANSGPLPEVADVRRRLGLGGDLTGAQTVGELFEEWFSAKSRRWRESTRKAYREKLDQHILPVIGDIPAERLNAAHVAEVITRIEARNAAIEAGEVKGKVVGPTSQVHIHGVIRAGLRWAVKQRKLQFDPSGGVELPEVRRRKAVVYDAAQTSAFLAHSADDRLAALYRLVLVRGLRRGEVIGLRWANVDLDGRRIRIAETVLQLSGRVTPGLPKTDAGERWVSLDATTVEALRAHRKAQLEERVAWGEAYQDSGLVFAREDGTTLRPDQVTKRFQVLAREAGLPVIRLHDGRHSAATLGLSAGLDIKIVSDLLGHSTSAITRDLYTHVLPAVHDEAADRMAKLIELPAAAQEASDAR